MELTDIDTEVWGPETTTESRLFVEGTLGWMESDAESMGFRWISEDFFGELKWDFFHEFFAVS